MRRYIVKLSNNEKVYLSSLTVDELRRLHFDEEVLLCKQALALPPFSLERNNLMNKIYEFSISIKNEISRKQHGKEMKSMGASKRSVNLLVRLIAKKLRNNTNIIVYEAGVGGGYALKELLANFKKDINSKKLVLKGCDIVLQPAICSMMQTCSTLDVTQGHILDCIKQLPDSSIDLFYADNVVEHFFPDEADIIFAEIERKLKPGAIVYLLIPNKYVGPCDVSAHYLPFGAKALGTHFMEMSFNEVVNTLSKYNIYPSHFICALPIPRIFLCIKSNALISSKLTLEPYIAKIPIKFIRRFIFAIGSYRVSIMSKIA